KQTADYSHVAYPLHAAPSQRSISFLLAVPAALAQRDLLPQEWVRGACEENDPEMSTWLLRASDGNQEGTDTHTDMTT
ncbi:mCG145105, partial [Mus musculus]